MKRTLLPVFAMFLSCSPGEKEKLDNESNAIEQSIRSFHQGLSELYNKKEGNVDSLFASFFVDSSWYVTYWGVIEPIDSTKERLVKALPLIREYSYRIEMIQVQLLSNCAYALAVVRQSYILQDDTVDEYLPTTYVLHKNQGQWKTIHFHRSADLQTIEHIIARTKIQ